MEQVTYTEEEFNTAIDDLKKEHEEEIKKELRFVKMDNKLDILVTSVKHADTKICTHMDNQKENNKKFMTAIENMGTERRECERDVYIRIDKKVKERNDLIEKLNKHVTDNFVTTKSLNKYFAIVVLTVGFTVSIITYIGQSKSLNADQIKLMIKEVVKEVKKEG